MSLTLQRIKACTKLVCAFAFPVSLRIINGTEQARKSSMDLQNRDLRSFTIVQDTFTGFLLTTIWENKTEIQFISHTLFLTHFLV